MNIEWSESGLVKVEVGGRPIGLLHSVSFQAAHASDPVVELEFSSLPDGCSRGLWESMREAVEAVNLLPGTAVLAPCVRCMRVVWHDAHSDDECAVMQVMGS